MTSLEGSSPTSGLPDFSRYGFRIESELGVNRAGGRVTYLATHLKTKQRVVIKQFQFAKSSDWGGYDTLQQEGQVLKSLKHPGIPRYLGVFKSPDGFCMVQECKRARSLAEPRSFSPDAIRQIAISCLEILIYLQTRIPPIIHRDFKPANILVSDDLKVYLVDFGFARIGDGEVGMSSVVKGTLGFMPPEQIFNRQLTEASDLYGLGMTLICLLTNTPANNVGKLVDVTYQVDFTQLKADLSPQWIAWLGKMVQPRLSERFENASVALANIPDHGLRQPQVQFSQSTINLVANNREELITTAITLNNSVPETTLTGHWHVAPHNSDPTLSDNQHSWIQFSPADFQDNHITTEIQIDTSQLMAGQTYQRTLVLKSNAHPAVHYVNLTVQSAPFPFPTKETPYPLVFTLLVACWITVWGIAALFPEYDVQVSGVDNYFLLMATFGCGWGFEIAAWLLHEAKLIQAARTIAVAGIGLIALVIPIAFLFDVVAVDGISSTVIAGLGGVGGSILGIIMGLNINRFLQKAFQPRFAITTSILTGLFGTLLGLNQGLALSNPWFFISLAASGFAVAIMLTYWPIQRAQAIALYRRHAEHHLIQP